MIFSSAWADVFVLEILVFYLEFMVVIPRRRRLFRAISFTLIFAGCLLILQRWKASTHSKYITVTTKHRTYSLEFTHSRRSESAEEDVNVTETAVNERQEIKQSKSQRKKLPPKPNLTWIHHPWTSSLRGFLNVHVWRDWCGSTVNDLRRNIHFPKYPDIRLKSSLFHISHDAHNYGQRVFGFLHPPKTGNYTFAISSDDTSELWLSSNHDPQNARLIAWVGNRSDPLWEGVLEEGEFTTYESQISAQIYLRRNRRYFVEALHKQSSWNDHLLVAWKIPRLANFSHITRGRISQYVHPHELLNLDVARYARHIPLSPAVLQKPLIPHKLRDKIPVDILDQNSGNKIPASGDEHLYRRENFAAQRKDPRARRLKDVIPRRGKFPASLAPLMFRSCGAEYWPSYRVEFKVARYEGVYLIHESSVYPDDWTQMKHVQFYKPCYEMRVSDSHGDLLPGVDQEEADDEQLENSDATETQPNLTARVLVRGPSHGNRKVFDLANVAKMFKKRKILAVLSQGLEKGSDASKYERGRETGRHMVAGTSEEKRPVLEKKKRESNYSLDTLKTAEFRGNRGMNRTSVDRSRIIKDSHGRERIPRHASNAKFMDQKSSRGNDRVHQNSLKRRKFVSLDKKAGLRGQMLEKQGGNVLTEKKVSVSTPRSKLYQRHGGIGESEKRRSYETRVGNPSVQDKPTLKPNILRKKVVQLKPNEFPVAGNVDSRGKPVVWHRKRAKASTTAEVFVKESSPLARTFRRLQETGHWAGIKAYAKRNGLLLTHKTWMYVTWKYLRYEKPKKPHEKLVEFIYKQIPSSCRTDGNIVLNEKVAKGVVNKFMKDVREHFGSDVYLKRIVNVEENHDVLKGDRYLIELDLGVNNENKTYFVSDYVYLPLGGSSFCTPNDFVWRRNVTVHVIVPVKDLGKWVQHFIDDMSELYKTTQDSHVNVIIVDFNSTDIDIEQALKQSALTRYRYLKVNGSFQRALGVQIGADVVENPNDIIFTCDLHLEIPNNIIEVIRKHCIQGKMAFSPMVLRLGCGFTPSLPYGEWETMGYGLFAIYKSDFDRIGGMNIDEFKTKWGGEDWEMVDRFLQKQMEIERLRVPKFYHFFHSKQGMWGSYGFEDNVSGNLGDNIVEDELVPGYDADRSSRYSYNQPLMPEY